MDEALSYLYDILCEFYGNEYVEGGVAVGGLNMHTLNRLIFARDGYRNIVQFNESENLGLDLYGLEKYLKMDSI